MIELRAVTAGGFRDASFALAPGESCRLLLSSEADVTLLLRLLVGTARPQSGSVALFGDELPRLNDAAALALLSRLGIVFSEWSFVSNLKVWENILLPLWYHGDERAERREPEILELLERLGVEPVRVAGFLAALPANLSVRERRILGVVRAMLPDAETMVYAGLLDGLDAPTQARLLDETARHHGRRPGRATLFVASSAEELPGQLAGRSLRQLPDGGIGPWH